MINNSDKRDKPEKLSIYKKPPRSIEGAFIPEPQIRRKNEKEQPSIHSDILTEVLDQYDVPKISKEKLIASNERNSTRDICTFATIIKDMRPPTKIELHQCHVYYRKLIMAPLEDKMLHASGLIRHGVSLLYSSISSHLASIGLTHAPSNNTEMTIDNENLIDQLYDMDVPGTEMVKSLTDKEVQRTLVGLFCFFCRVIVKSKEKVMAELPKFLSVNYTTNRELSADLFPPDFFAAYHATLQQHSLRKQCVLYILLANRIEDSLYSTLTHAGLLSHARYFGMKTIGILQRMYTRDQQVNAVIDLMLDELDTRFFQEVALYNRLLTEPRFEYEADHLKYYRLLDDRTFSLLSMSASPTVSGFLTLMAYYLGLFDSSAIIGMNSVRTIPSLARHEWMAGVLTTLIRDASTTLTADSTAKLKTLIDPENRAKFQSFQGFLAPEPRKAVPTTPVIETPIQSPSHPPLRPMGSGNTVLAEENKNKFRFDSDEESDSR